MKHATRFSILFFALLFLVLFNACSQPSSDPASTPTLPTPTPTPTATPTPMPQVVVLPQDDAPHQGVNTEWWYYNGHLKTSNSERYDFHYVVFQVTQPGLPAANIAHLAITDPQKGVYSTEQKVLPVFLAAKAGEGFGFDINGWQISGYDGNDHLAASTADYGFDIELSSEKPPASHGGTGLVDFEEAGQSYYYSRTRMGASGVMTANGVETPVKGYAWFDHQWGNFEPRDIGWDWFALQLDDGSDIMLTLLRDAENQPLYSYGTYVAPEGTASNVSSGEFQVSSAGSWTSPASGIAYPMGWQVRVPGRGIDLTITPILESSEFDATSTTQNYYWEGGVDITGTHTGEGFVELTGYKTSKG